MEKWINSMFILVLHVGVMALISVQTLCMAHIGLNYDFKLWNVKSVCLES